jgi:hypothetical protein
VADDIRLIRIRARVERRLRSRKRADILSAAPVLV